MTREMLRRLERRELAPREIAEVLRHIGECEECARASAEDVDLGALDAATSGDEGPWHPDAVAIAAYVDGTADAAEREIVATHLEDCSFCREDVADLAKLRGSRAPRRRVWQAAFAVAAALVVVLFVILRVSDGREPAPTSPHVPPRPVVVTTQPPAPASPRYANGEWERLVRTAIETRRLPSAHGIDAAPDVLRGSSNTTAANVAPNGVVIDEVRPRFSWPARDGATYVVSIFDGDRRVAQSEPLTKTQWTPPAPLARGRTYVWQVQATRDETREIIPAPPAPPATFHVVSQRDHDDLTAARNLHPDDPLLHAVLAARAGLREEALRELSRAHTNIRPD
ncbi:MAG TPA: hypothetical protein VJZ00_10900 [Thermoanaerobaculia bacterium]|nr:hypothetical protein [Thermoanaerobaculia bacterium]